MNLIPSLLKFDLLPWSEVAEQSVLGALLIDNEAFGIVNGLLTPASFWHPPHRMIFEAIQRLISIGKPADTVLVFDELEASGLAETVGGLAYLNSLAQCVPSAANCQRYSQVVADKALRRDILSAADDTVEVVGEAVSADEVLDRVQTKFAALKRVNGSKEPRELGDLLIERTAYWEGLQAGDTEPGIPTGLAALDEALGGGIKPGKVIVLAARPSVGKTSLATQILLHVAGQGRRALMLSQEMTAGELTDRAAAHLGAVRMDRLASGQLEQEDWTRIVEAAERARRMPVSIDDQGALSLLDIRAKARQVLRRGSLSLIVVDYLQLCANPGGDKRHRHHQIEEISRGLKVLAKELGVTVLLLSQLNRASEGDEPELHHLKESGAIEEDADTVLLLHPMGNEADGSMLVLLKVAKNRAGRRGRMGLSFDGRTQRWTESVGNVSRRST
ncbi:replicative DNA helicase [Roseateles sp. P5_E4]